MSSIKRSHILLSALLALVLGGCGDKNDKAAYSPESGHPVNWNIAHKEAAATELESCVECHGANLSGGIVKVGCFSTPQASYNGLTCHATNPVIDKNCSSCHGAPPNGAAAPNRAGAHAKHLALSGVTCATCHNDAGFGTANHGKKMTVSALPNSFKAKDAPAFGYNDSDGSCSGVSCHGGQKTPKWDSAVAISCIQCHEQGTAAETPQYNSFYSGLWTITAGSAVNLHKLHNSVNIQGTTTRVACSNCHSVPYLVSQHYSGLSTSVFEGSAAGSVGGAGTMISNYVPYTSATPSGSCTSACHYITNSNPRNWVSP